MKKKYWLAFAVVAVLAVGALSYSLGSGTSFQGRAALAVTHEKCVGVFGTWVKTQSGSILSDYTKCKEKFAALWNSMVRQGRLQLIGSTDESGLDVSFRPEMKLAKVRFHLLNNGDRVADTANLEKIRITVIAANADASNFKLYPAERYNDDYYALEGELVADGVIEFDFRDNEISEGRKQTYIVKADTVAGTNGSLDVKIAYSGNQDAGIQAYGRSADLQWKNGLNTFTWFRTLSGAGALPLRYVSSSSSTGTPDPSLLDFQE